MVSIASAGRFGLAALFALALAACGKPTEESAGSIAATQADTAAYGAALDALTKGYFNLQPEAATANGISEDIAPGAGEHLNDRSPAGEAERREKMETLLAEFKAVDASGLNAEGKRNRDTLITLLEGALAPARVADYGGALSVYGLWFTPYAIIQNSGPTVDIPNMIESQQLVRNEDEAESYIKRLEAIDLTLDGALEKLKADVALGAIPPDFIVAKSKAVTDAFVAMPPEENVLYVSFVDKLENAELPDANRYAARALAIISDEVFPAYQRISDYLGAIEADAPHDAGVWRLPNGEAFYKAMVRHMTDDELSPDGVHETGLREVARITAEMDTLLKAQGLSEGTVGERMEALGGDPRFVYPNTDEGKAKILEDINEQLAAVNAVLPQWFGKLPKYEVVVRAVPAFSQDSAPGGYYDNPAPDGSRPGTYWINLRDTAIWPKFAVPTLTYHEAIPGHHMQAAVALDREAPALVKAAQSNASAEGWGLYAEALAAEMGLYADDPYGDLGRLQDELHRAIRLVVDTGMHWKRWSREDAIDYMVETEGVERSEAVSEIERYVVWPGQALGYKIGMLEIQALRARAEKELGEDFDIRGFHDRILSVSTSPLPVIDREIDAWIAEQKSPRD